MTQSDPMKQTVTYLQSLDPELNLDSMESSLFPEHNTGKQTLAIKLLSILGGLLSSFTFFGFLLVAGLYKSNTALFVLGVLAIITSLLIAKKNKQILWDTISVATFSIGFMMLGMALFEFKMDENYISLFFAALALLCLFLTSNYVISFIATLILNGSLLALLLLNNCEELIHLQVSAIAILLSYSFLQEAKLLHKSFKTGFPFHAVRTGLLVCFLLGLTLSSENIFFSLSGAWSWSTSVLSTLIIFFLTYRLLQNFGISDTIRKLAIYGLTLLVLAPTLLFPGIAGSILLLLLCFRVNYKTGFILSTIALIWFIGKFYYDLNYTLLTKSILLFISGIVFLLFYLFISKRSKHEKI